MNRAIAATAFVAWALLIGWTAASGRGWISVVVLLAGVFVGVLWAGR